MIRIKILQLFFLIFLIASLSLTLVMSLNISLNLQLETGDWLKYEVLTSSETENMFFGNWPPGNYYGNWSVQPNDTIIFSITSVSTKEINGTLFLGNELENTTFYDVRNVDVAFGLSLSIYPWNGGFLANGSDWNNIEVQIQNTNTTINSLSNHKQTINGSTNMYEVKSFDTQDYYAQYSKFYYHVKSGILLQAYTSYGLYELNISLISSSLEINPYTAKTTADFYSLFTIIFLIPFIIVRRQKRVLRRINK